MLHEVFVKVVAFVVFKCCPSTCLLICRLPPETASIVSENPILAVIKGTYFGAIRSFG